MKYFSKLLILCLFTFFAIGVHAAMKPIEFEIYPSMTTVIFEADVESNTVLSIPSTFEMSSIKIVERQGAQNVSSFKTETGIGDFSAPADLKPKKDEIEVLNKKIDELSAKLSGIELSGVILDNLNAEKVKTEELQSFIKQTAELRTKAELETKSLNNEINQKKEIVKALEADYTKKLPRNWNERINISVVSNQKGKIYIEATTYQSGWTPSYKLGLNSLSGKISTELFASTYQNSGINWSGRVKFYTQNPMPSYAQTELAPLVANIYKPANVMPLKSRIDKDAKYGAVTDMEMLVDEPMAQAAGVTMQQSIQNTSFSVNATIATGKAIVSIPLRSFSLDSKVTFEAIPSLNNKAFINAEIKNIPENIIPGKASLYIDGVFSHDVGFHDAPSGSDVDITFGNAANIITERKTLIQKKDTSWGKGLINDGYDIEIINGSDKDKKIVVKDRIPVSADSKISIDNIVTTPKADIEKDGICTWEISLKPKEKSKITVRYTVKYPSDSEVIFQTR